ncbi:hypothetical protein Q1695_008541 [Nippostrongylus brasiliensis]|nr:hypothetical protein Q1695_008541 [Nippostrongylus brasiliensis]
MLLLLIDAVLITIGVTQTDVTTTMLAPSATGTTDATGANTNTTRTSDVCEDQLPDCTKYVKTLCQNRAYKAMMKRFCGKTCNLCDDMFCDDLNRNCQYWNRTGFCTSRFYSDVMKKAYCALTCNMCDHN